MLRGYAEFAVLVALSLVAPAALGDAPCYKGYRDTTPAERARITTALQAAKDAMPPAPEGWRIRGDDQFSVTSSLCQDRQLFPWNYSYTRGYGQFGDAAAREKLMQDAAAAMAAKRAAKQPQLDALQAQMQDIMQKQIALNQKQDYAGAEKLQPQAKKLEAEYEKLLAEISQPVEEAGTAYDEDRDMSVTVEVNGSAERPGPGATNLPLPSGARAAVRWQPENPEATDDHALYLFGNWKLDPDGSWLWAMRDGIPPSGPQAIAVKVTADRERLASFVQEIDFAKIAAIVK
jgi:hypothetical protein